MPLDFPPYIKNRLPTFWEIEDLIYPGFTYIAISPNSVFYQSFIQNFGILNDPNSVLLSSPTKGIQAAKFFLSQGNWNRDPILKTYDKFSIYLCYDSGITRYDKTKESGAIFSGKRDRRYQNLLSFYSTGIAHQLDYNHFSILRTSQKFVEKFHSLPIAGGNVITPRRTCLNEENQIIYDEMPVFIVGRGALLLTASCMSEEDINTAAQIDPKVHDKQTIDHIIYTYFNGSDSPSPEEHDPSRSSGAAAAAAAVPNSSSTHSHASIKDKIFFAKQYIAAKILIRAFFTCGHNLEYELHKNGPLKNLENQIVKPSDGKPIDKYKSVLFVNQWAYHIDLQMLYIGCGTMLVHDFDATLTMLQKNRHIFPDSMFIAHFLAEATALRNQYQSSVETSIHQLKKFGLTVVRIPGLLIPHRNIVRGTLTGDKRSSRINQLSFNFINSLAIAPIHTANEINFNAIMASSKPGNPLFQLMHAHIQSAVSEALSPKLKKKVSITFIPIQATRRDEQISAEEFMLTQSGGFRCQTTLCPKDFIANVCKAFAYEGRYQILPPILSDVRWIRRITDTEEQTYACDLTMPPRLIKKIQYMPETWENVGSTTTSPYTSPISLKSKGPKFPSPTTEFSAAAAASQDTTFTERRRNIFVPPDSYELSLAERDDEI